MNIRFRCPKCHTLLAVEPIEASQDLPCPSCGAPIAFTPSKLIVEENQVDTCPRCGKPSFYTQKDFNQKLGLAVVVVCALVGLVFVWLARPIYFYASLGAGVLIDLALYLALPEITVCYACKTVFRNTAANPDHGPFDLHIADHYEGRSQG